MTYDEIRTYTSVPLNVVAKELHTSFYAVRDGMQNGRFTFGTALRRPGGGWSYVIPPERFISWLRGQDLEVAR